MPFPLPIEDNIGVVVEDGLALSDLSEQAALGRVIDHHPVDGGVAHRPSRPSPRTSKFNSNRKSMKTEFFLLLELIFMT